MERTPGESRRKAEKKDVMLGALAGAIGVGALSLGLIEAPAEPTNWDEIRAASSLDLQPLEQIANARLEIKGKKYIIDIGQLHGGGSLDGTRAVFAKEGIPFERLIECNKQIEQTITYLKDAYGITNVYMENLLPSDADWYRDFATSLRADPHGTSMQLIEKHAGDTASAGAFERYDALDFLFASQVLHGTPEGNQFANHPLIAGDLKYAWGAPYLMAARGTIRIFGAEDAEANSLANNFGLTSPNGHSIRQDAAIETIHRYEDGKHDSVALVYGAAHDFLPNVTHTNNETSEENRFGLIRIEPNACHK